MRSEMTTLTHTRTSSSGTNTEERPTRIRAGIAWTLQVLTAALFLFAGVSKLAGAPMMVQTFATIGVGQWFRYLTGAIEVVSAVLLLVPSLAIAGASALAVTMVGAIVTHLFIIGGNPAVPVALLASTAAIIVLRRSQRWARAGDKSLCLGYDPALR